MSAQVSSTHNKPTFFILILSVVLMVVLFFVQSRSDNSIRALQSGNELAVKTFQVNNGLQEIINNVYFIESESKKAILSNDPKEQSRILDTVQVLEKQNAALRQLIAGLNNKNLATQLNQLVSRKITLSKTILNPNNLSGLALLEGQQSRELIDSIYGAASDLQSAAEFTLRQTIVQNTSVSSQVLLISRLLTIFALVVILLAASFGLQFLRRNHELIVDLEQARQKADHAGRIKEQFLANMSHEIRTPLNSIIGFSQLAAETPLNAEQEEYVRFIRTSGENLLYIINDILDFSKLEAGKMPISKVPFVLSNVVHFIELMFQVHIKEKDLRFTVTVDEDLPQNLTGDDNRLKQILTNLVSNAIKFTEAGGRISLRVKKEKASEDEVYVRFEVKDSGIGIPTHKLESIFERFEQADAATTRKFGGTGLGLAIVKQLAALQNGYVQVESTVNQGSQFSVILPYTIYQVDTKEENHKMVLQHGGSYNRKARILVAEDNRMNQMFVTYLFQKLGLQFDVAKDGQEAITSFENQPYDLVLIDIQMPILDGYGVADHIRKKLGSQVPIVAMTAHTLPIEKEKCFAHGMNGYLSKPLREQELLAVFNEFVPAPNSPTTMTAPIYVDVNSLKKMFGDEPDIILAFLQEFQTQFPLELEKFEKALEEKNLTQVLSLAHNLKTTVGTIHASSPLIEPLRNMEKFRQSPPQWEEILAWGQRVTDAKEKIMAELTAIRDKGL